MCNCGKKGKVNYFSTEEQAKIAKARGTGGVITSAGSSRKPAKAVPNKDLSFES